MARVERRWQGCCRGSHKTARSAELTPGRERSPWAQYLVRATPAGRDGKALVLLQHRCTSPHQFLRLLFAHTPDLWPLVSGLGELADGPVGASAQRAWTALPQST